MPARSLCLLPALALFASAPSGAHAETMESAQIFLEAIYDRYVGPEGHSPGVALDEDEVMALFEPSLAEMIVADRLEADCAQEPPRLNGDPFVGRQDWIIAGYAIAMMRTGEDEGVARVLARLDFDAAHPIGPVQVHMSWLDEAWRISEIEWDDTTLREVLSDD
jgi:hypothetical protein